MEFGESIQKAKEDAVKGGRANATQPNLAILLCWRLGMVISTTMPKRRRVKYDMDESRQREELWEMMSFDLSALNC